MMFLQKPLVVVKFQQRYVSVSFTSCRWVPCWAMPLEVKQLPHPFYRVLFLCRITVDGRNPAQLGCQNPCNLWDIYHIIWCRISSINRVNVKCCIANGPCQVRVTLVESNVSPMLVLNLSTWTSDWCFKYCVFSSLPEEMIQFDSYFSDGLNTTN